ncbi:DnaJ domain-containing protein [Dichotomicrobium thermohalophilum]|uniref:DnaJ-like protein n=1 Tax=Dichotomicrobium thermohalophilum TaxID=933063 RepID=A0A397Q456_9HYPH|nr:DnaJ domain-containing protein [Dichotomicrobium thermohalophilum]RIA55838.1 DnaJ-like protein [Dichotomicrobium thermohalophilum]
MQFLIIGVLLLLLLLLYAGRVARMSPKAGARAIRRGGGYGLLGLAIGLGLAGRIGMAIPLALIGGWLLGWRLPSIGGQTGPIPGNARPSGGQASTVRAEFVEMTLDHDTGNMDGEVLAGQYAGRRLSSMETSELLTLLRETLSHDAQSAKLVEAYLDRVAPDWRDQPGARASETSDAAASGPMTIAEAYRILGLWPGAKPEEIRRAHREMMKKFHPDQGGSTYLAMKINEAKDTLLAQFSQKQAG